MSDNSADFPLGHSWSNYSTNGEEGTLNRIEIEQSSIGSSPTTPTTPEPPASSSKGKASEVIQRDDSYYMESNFAVFQVQKCLFRVPYYLLSKESHVFAGLFNLPQAKSKEDGDIEGTSASNPIILPDEYLKEDFRNLMKALYPLSFTLTLQLLKSEWISVLKLSTQWYLINLRKAAISELERMAELTSVEKIVLGRRYQISSWIISGFADLVTRNTTIDDDEAIDIDSDYVTTAYKLYRMREDRIRTSYFRVETQIENIFGAELQVVRADEKGYEMPQDDIGFEPDFPLKEPLTRAVTPTVSFPDNEAEQVFTTWCSTPVSEQVFATWCSTPVLELSTRDSSVKKSKKKKKF